MSFAKWLRSNSEYHLMRDAQNRTARALGLHSTVPVRGLKEAFWRWLFVPIYRSIPWGMRRTVMRMLPGSHRQDWPKKSWRHPGN